MGTTIARLWRGNMERGVALATTERQARQIRTSNIVGVVFPTASLPFVVLFEAGGSHVLALGLLTACLLYASPLFFNPRGSFWLGRAIPLMTACVVATILASALGRESNVHVTLFMLACWGFALFDARSELPSLLALTAIPTVGFILVSAGANLGVPPVNLTERARQIMSVGGGIVAFTMFVTVLTLLYRHDQQVEDRLRNTVGELRREVKRRTAAEVAAMDLRDQAQSAARAKDEFLGVVSHELRTPLNGIMGATELLADSSLNAEQRDLLGIVSSSSESLLALIEDVLSFSTMEAIGVQLASEPVDLRQVVGDCADSVCASATRKGLYVIVDILPQVPYQILGDAGRLRQVVANLLTNAVKFTDRGHVAVRVSAEFDNRNATCTICLEVIDTGIGIPAELRDAIFDRFVQADLSRSRRFGGAGLGLTIAKRLAECMAGAVGVTDGPEGGSRFWFEAKFRVSAHAVPGLAHPIAVAVDADSETRTSVEHALEALGARVCNAAADADVVLVSQYLPKPDHPRVLEISSVTSPSAESGVLPTPVRSSTLLRLLEKAAVSSPSESNSTATVASANHELRNASCPRVLVVEDNAVNQKILVRALQKMGLDVATANNGCEALDSWKRERFGVVLMDVQMPEMDGLEATRCIRQLERGVRSTIVGVSANAYPEDVELGMGAGMDGYITKPVRRDTLQRLFAAVSAGGNIAEALVPPAGMKPD